MAVKSYIESHHIPTVMTVGGDPVISGGKFGPFTWTFKSPQRSSIAVRKVYEYLKKNKVTKVALLTASDGFGRDGLRWLKKFASEYEIEVVAHESFNPKDTDMTTQLVKIKSTPAQAVICWTIGPAGALVAQYRHALGQSGRATQASVCQPGHGAGRRFTGSGAAPGLRVLNGPRGRGK
jgi:branched-chain amino acid transport system substrate-binding protein